MKYGGKSGGHHKGSHHKEGKMHSEKGGFVASPSKAGNIALKGHKGK